MRRWLVEETGEVRKLKHGDPVFVWNRLTIWRGSLSESEYPILRVTELPPEEEKLPRLEE